MTIRFHERYHQVVKPALMQEFGYQNPMQVPRLDKIVVNTGRDKGKAGEVLRVLPAERRLIVQGVHVARRHTKPRMGDPGGIVDKELTIHVSNVAHIDPQSGKPTRVGYKTLDNGRKVRVARRSGEVIDK